MERSAAVQPWPENGRIDIRTSVVTDSETHANQVAICGLVGVAVPLQQPVTADLVGA